MFDPQMNWRKSVWTKLIAACFIGLIVVGNIWLVMGFSMATPPFWLQTCFVLLTGALFVFGAAFLAERLFLKITKVDDDSHDTEI